VVIENMAIKDTLVWVGVDTNREHYKKLGYHIPMRLDNRGRSITPRGTKILVSINDLPKYSRFNIVCICDYCGAEFKKSYCDLVVGRERSSGKDCCGKCAGKKAWEKIKPKDGESLADKYPELALQWSSKNIQSPNTIYPRSSKAYLWVCNICGYEWEAIVSNRTRKNKAKA